jgi:hypothetical protein
MSKLAAPVQRAIGANFPGLTISYDEPPRPIVTIEPVSAHFGPIEIVDDDFEITVNCGRFTHVHISNYDDGISPEERTERLVESLLEFLTDVFSDRLDFWGTHLGGGGCRLRDQPSILPRILGGQGVFTWSGTDQ